jgi:uncharacterized protein
MSQSSNLMQTPQQAVLTPCIGVCTYNPAGFCDGCLRTGDEICDWIDMSDEQRLHIMNVVLPEREARLSTSGATPPP